MSKLAIISEETVRKIVTRQLAFDAVRAAFEAVSADRARVFELAFEPLPATDTNRDNVLSSDSHLRERSCGS